MIGRPVSSAAGRSPLKAARSSSEVWTYVEATFWERVEITEGCWLWIGHVNKTTGYAQLTLRVPGRSTPVTCRVSRLAYEMFVGPIPPGWELDHLCHSMNPACAGGPICLHRSCVNPHDLQAVTPKENKRRALTNTAAANWQRRKTHCPKGHPYEGANLRVYEGHRQCVACNKERNAAFSAERSRINALSFFGQKENDNSLAHCDSAI